MGVFNLYANWLEFKRAVQIFFIVFKQSLKTLFSRGSAGKNPDKTRKNVVSTPERFRMTIEELGPTYIKFGQILADRPDILPERYRKELSKLQSEAGTFSTNEAICLIQQELKTRITNVFSWFDTVPLAAASIGQVYRARLVNGDEVIVKIQRPNIENKIKIDVALMQWVAKRITRSNPELSAINLKGLIDEFSMTINNELDYFNEANNTKFFGKMFACDPTVKIPAVYDEYTTKKVIVIEYIEGIAPTDLQVLIDNGLDPQTIVNNGAKAIFKMILEYGVFHADPHSGNILLMKDNVVAFIDFGMVGMLHTREMNFLADFTYGYSKQDASLVCKAILRLCDIHFFKQEDDMTFDIKLMFMHNESEKSLDIANFANMLQGCINIIIKYQLKVPSGVLMLVKTLITLEKFADKLETEVDMENIILPYSNEIRSERFSARAIAGKIYSAVSSYVTLFNELPGDISEILYKLKEGKIKHDIKLKDRDVFVSTTKRISLRIAYVILLIGLFIGSSILVVMEYEKRFGLFVLYTTSILILLLLIRWLFVKKK